MGPDLAEDGLDVDRQVSMRTSKAPDDAEAQTLGALFQMDAAGSRTPEGEEGEGYGPGVDGLLLQCAYSLWIDGERVSVGQQNGAAA